jgi:hypothetical protein
VAQTTPVPAEAAQVVRPAHLAPATRPAASREGGLATWLLAFVLLFVAAGSWSLAAPLGSSPDEPAQLIRAASLVRGQLVGRALPGAGAAQGSVVVVQVPEVFAALANDVSCFDVNPWKPAGCQLPLGGSTVSQPVETYVGRYPPLYYALVGLPTLALVSVKGIYAARLVSAALSAAMLALAVVSVRRCRGRPLFGAGLSLAVTPMVLYMAGMLNPSGFEVSAAVAVFSGALALASLPLERVGPAVLAALGVPAMCLMLVRSLAPLWVLAALAVLVVLRPWREVAALLRRRAVRRWMLAGVVAAGLGLAWDMTAGALRLQPGMALPEHADEAALLHAVIDRMHLIAVSSIGQFGWLDTPSPLGVVTAWTAGFGLLAALALLSARRRQVAAIVGTGLAWAAFCFLFVWAMVPSHGLVGQGRDFLGLAVGMPLVAGVCVRPSALPGWLRSLAGAARYALPAAAAVCQVADFYWVMRRYDVGLEGPMDPFAHVAGGWAPPVPGPVLTALFVVAVGGTALLLGALGANARLTAARHKAGSPSPSPSQGWGAVSGPGA